MGYLYFLHLIILAWILSIVRADEPCSEKGCFTRETIQVFKTFIGNRLFNGRRLFTRMEACFEKHVADGIDMMIVSDTYWSKLVAYGVQKGVDGDSWPGFIGFIEDKPTPLISKRNLKRFPSYPPESANITVLEPCNTVSNWAFHQAMLELCESRLWSSEEEDEEWFTGLIRAFHFMGPGSVFMHASGTQVGGVADNESIRQLAFWYLQYGLQELPYDPVIHDLREDPAPRTALEVIKDLNEMFLSEPVTTWQQTILDFGTPAYESTFSATVIAILHTIFYRSQTVEKLTDILAGLLVAGEDLAFIKERFSPTVREAILQQNTNISPLNRLQLLLQFTGLMTKMIWAFYWQEDTFVGGHLTRRWDNVLGSAVTPLVNALSNAVTGFNRSRGLNLQLSQNAYPGDIRCNRRQPHSKWHEIAANGLVDVAFAANSVNRLLAGGSLERSLPTSVNAVVQCFERGWSAQSNNPSDDALFSSSSQDALLGGILEECAAPNMFDLGQFLSCLTGKVVQLSKTTKESTRLEQCLVDHSCIILDGTDLNTTRFHECLFGEDSTPCKSFVSPSATTNQEECLTRCSTDYLCAMTCLQVDFSPWLSQTISCANVLSASSPAGAAVADCQRQYRGERNTATALLTMLKRFASVSQNSCSKEHGIVLRNFATARACFGGCRKADDEIPVDFPCVIQCMALS